MTTKNKIILGFFFMIALLIVVSVLGYTKLQSSSESFLEYQRLSRLNVGTSELGAAVYHAGMNVYQFTDSRDPQFMDKARADLGEGRKFAEKILPDVRKADRKSVLQGITSELQTYQDMITKLQKAIEDSYSQYQNVVRKNMGIVSENLDSLSEQTRGMGNFEALYAITRLWGTLATMHASLSRFAESRDIKNEKATEDLFVQAREQLKGVESKLHTEEGKKLLVNASQSLALVNESYTRMEKLFEDSANIMTESRSVRQKLVATGVKMSEEVDAEMMANGGAMIADQAAGQKMTIAISSIGILIGLLAAVIIIRGLIVVLRDLSGLAAAVADGDFNYHLKVKEKG
jgi:methyl-accepting chemotaxis protein